LLVWYQAWDDERGPTRPFFEVFAVFKPHDWKTRWTCRVRLLQENNHV
jgi:hypothetical protein